MINVQNVLIEGDPVNPRDTDLIAQTANIYVGADVPDGWRVLSGGLRTSFIGRIAYRYEVKA